MRDHADQTFNRAAKAQIERDAAGPLAVEFQRVPGLLDQSVAGGRRGGYLREERFDLTPAQIPPPSSGEPGEKPPHPADTVRDRFLVRAPLPQNIAVGPLRIGFVGSRHRQFRLIHSNDPYWPC